MLDFKDFELDLTQTKGTSEPADTIITTLTTLASNTSTHCSPSDATVCRNIADPGKGVRC